MGNHLVLGAIVGDINGSIYEFNNIKSINFNLFTEDMFYTDDSILTLGVMKTLLEVNPFKNIEEFKKDLINNFVTLTKANSDRGFGRYFLKWIDSDDHDPYNSFGNGAAMRISPVSRYSKSLEEVKILSNIVTSITHNNPLSIEGSECLASSIYLAKIGSNKEKIKENIKKYYPFIDELNYDDLVKNYKFSSKIDNSLPQALFCFLISSSFESCLRLSISIGGDSDTIADMSCSLAEAFYKEEDLSFFKNKALSYLPKEYQKIIFDFSRVVSF